ncbi:alpha/beta-hydrolase [Acephala macrosclerotiorum]|nr:alpha/beta-hydrolase [Acephala macrosclerotiorum]
MHSLLTSAVLFAPTFALSQAFNSVTTTAGTLQGGICPGSTASFFLNVPYAIPPVGDRRFTSPQAYSGEYPTRPYDASTPGAACIQFGTTFVEGGPTSEDCLYLDIWVPPNATNTSDLPVKVWLYGGGEAAGGISDPLYNGCNLAEEGALLVSINYRLGSLGFLALESAGITGNFGIEDILLGLQWIQDNIAAFGGSTKKVLLFGQSAGATNAFIVSTLPQATSLINSVISESGAGRDVATSDVAYTLGASYADSLNCSDAACLRSKTTAELNATAPELPGTIIYSSLHPNTFQPYIDGKIIASQPSAVGTKVPTVYGSNANEGSIFVLGQYRSTNITNDQYNIFLQDNFGSAAQNVAQYYPLSAFSASPFPGFTAMSTIITDVSYFCPAYRALNSAARNGIPSWTYLFSHTPSCLWFENLFPPQALPVVQAAHTAEIAFTFGNLENLPLPNGTCNFTLVEHGISKALVEAWTSIAATGNPSTSSLEWPVWNGTASLGVNILNSTTVGVVNYTTCEFWDVIEKGLNFTSTNSTSNATTTGSSPKSTSSHSGGDENMTRSTLSFKIAALVLGGMIVLL